MEHVELYRLARRVLDQAYAPFSGFQVGAALLTESGAVYTGVNVENGSYGATICAERTALTSAVTDGHRRFQAIAVASSGGEAWPCGICRQFLFEFGDDCLVITGEDETQLHTMRIDQLLPHGFRLHNGNKSKESL